MHGKGEIIINSISDIVLNKNLGSINDGKEIQNKNDIISKIESLPIVKDKEYIEMKQEEKKENCLSLKGCRVLLVEDNEINREIALEMLREIGVDAESAVNGEECINMLLSHDRGYYSAVLMDIQMPVMDGYEAARKIRSFSDPLKRNIPIIAMTANAFEEDRQKAFRSGMNSHISKPIDTKLLTATLQSCLHERER